MFSTFPWRKRAYPGSAWTTKEAEVRPQAVESATIEGAGVWGIVATLLAYIGYAVYKDLQNEWPTIAELKELRERSRAEIAPQAEELPVSTPSPMEQKENVKFVDTHPGFKQEVYGDIDHIRDAPLAGDATLDEFFSRPLRIQSFDWPVNGTLFQRFNPWALYFENSRVINRISNYKLMRAKLHLKFTLNGNAFHYGRAICSYNPLPDDDNITVDRAFLDADLVGASQRPHVYLDPTNSQGGELKLPFFTYKNVLDIVNMDWRNMGELAVHSMQTLKHANGASDSVTINVFAWAEDVKFAIPTNFEPGAIVPQADEYEKRPVSRIAGAVANIAASMTSIPTIGPFARATEIGAKSIGAIATLFGYSAPLKLESQIIRPVAAFNIATTNQPNESAKLTLDCKNELTLDSRTVGLNGDDELSIKYITQRESWLTNFPWQIGTPQETLLWNGVVDPAVHYIQGNELHMPAVCFASVPFKYWRGTLKYRFQFVCSKYHKGRVKIVYDPTGTPPGGTAEYNTAYTTIVDISDNSDFEIEVGWGQGVPYREHFTVGTTNQTLMWNTTPLTTTTPASPVGNGTLAVYVVNELTVPNSTVNNDIEVNVFISAGDDFELAVPDGINMEFLKLTSAGALIAPQACEEIIPHAGESEVITEDSKPSNVTSLNTVGLSVNKMDETNLVYFGESVHSFRSLLKRYCRHGLISGNIFSPADQPRLTANRHAFPYPVGYTDPSAITGGAVVFGSSGGTVKYVYGKTTLLNYLSCAYGGWRGSIRWVADMTRFGSANNVPPTMTITRRDNASGNFDFWEALNDPTWSAAGQAAVWNIISEDASTFSGQTLISNQINPVAMFEVPYYKNLRFTPAKRRLNPSDPDGFQPGWTLQMVQSTTQYLGNEFGVTMCAAGEDFNLFFFLGAPIMYYDPGSGPT